MSSHGGTLILRQSPESRAAIRASAAQSLWPSPRCS